MSRVVTRQGGCEGVGGEPYFPAGTERPTSGSRPHSRDEVRVSQGRTSQADEKPDAPPSGIDFSLGKAESAGCGGGVVIVVQAFAYHEPRQPLIVRRQVVEGPSSKAMTDSIDRPSTEQIVGGMDSGCHKCELPAEQEHEESHTQAEAHQRMVEEKSVPAISRKVAGISGHRRRIPGHLAVQTGRWRTGHAHNPR